MYYQQNEQYPQINKQTDFELNYEVVTLAWDHLIQANDRFKLNQFNLNIFLYNKIAINYIIKY